MIAMHFSTDDVNRLIQTRIARGTSVVYAHGSFDITHPVPIGLAQLVAVPYLRGGDFEVAIPFSQMSVPVLPNWLTASVASLVWSPLSTVIEKTAGDWLRRQGLPPGVMTVKKGTDQNGATVGVIAVNMDHVHAWIDRMLASAPVVFRVAAARFDSDGVHLGIETIS
jgi:hypothetical protein